MKRDYILKLTAREIKTHHSFNMLLNLKDVHFNHLCTTSSSVKGFSYFQVEGLYHLIVEFSFLIELKAIIDATIDYEELQLFQLAEW